jgi:cyclin-dependent kinase 10
VVYRARELATSIEPQRTTTSRVVALKQACISAEEQQIGIPITALREICILRSLKHPNIINVLDVAVGEHAMDEVYMVMEYAEQVGDSVPRVEI